MLNVGSGRQVTVGELVALAREELGWEARTPLPDGFRGRVRWLADDPARRAGYAEAIEVG